MADIVQSLFGVTPEMYQQSQQARADQQAMQYAKLSPFEQANFAIGRGATMLGGVAGRALGGEDPELARISARQQISKQINYNDPASIAKGVQMLSVAGDTQGAMMLADVGRKAASELALAQQRTAAAGRETQQAIPPAILTAQTVANLKIGISRLEALPESPERDENLNRLRFNLEELQRQGAGKPPEFLARVAELQGLKANLRVLKSQPEPNKEAIQRIEDSIQAIEGVEKDPRFGSDREAIAGEMFDNKSFAQLTPTQKAAVNKRIEDEQGKRAEKGAPKTYLPNQPIAPKDWMDFTKNILSGDPVMQRTSTILSDAPSAIEIIRNSTLNDFAAASLPTSMALLTGQGKNMSNADVNRFARTGGLDDRLAQDAVKFFTGGTTEVKKDQAEKFAIALYRGALIERKKKLETAAEEFGYTTSPNYKFALKNIDDQLNQFKLVKKGESAPSTRKTGIPLLDKYLPQEESK